MPLGTEVGLGIGDIMLDEDPPPFPKKAGSTAAPTFRPMYCGQMSGWIKKPLSKEVGFSPGHIVLDGDPAPPKKGEHSSPLMRPTLLQSL